MTHPPRVVILGGGMGGLSAAWRLSEPGWQSRFGSITVLERGFRLGGKGASSRGVNGRVEEHGLHVWLGHYDNGFRVMRDCYAELDRPQTDPQSPIRTWRDAFFPNDQLGLFDRSADGWSPWVARFSPNRLVPGDTEADGHAPSVVELLLRSALLLRDFYASLEAAAAGTITLSTSPSVVQPWSGRALRSIGATLLAVSQQLLTLSRGGSQRLAGQRGADAIDAAFAPLLSRLSATMSTNVTARRLHDLVDLVRGVLRGMAVDGLEGDRDAYDAINHLDFREWLSRHGAAPTTLQSPIVRGQYDLTFSHENGDPARPRFAAGWGVNLSSKLWFEYKGAIFWKMRAGMGDVVFAPLYQALVSRGVEFRFFHEVTDVVPTADGSAIGSIAVQQTSVVAAGASAYRPLVRVKGLPVFPATPDRSQLVDAAAARTHELVAGEDFDLVVLAVPPPMARLVGARLAAQRAEWQAMLDHVGTVATHAFQLWLRPEESALGWPHAGATVSAFAKPFDTLASMSHLGDLEDWPEGQAPGTITYFCSTLKGPSTQNGGGDAADRTRAAAIAFVQQRSRHFWPNAVDPATREFRWDLLCADSAAAGVDRFDTQFWTANTDPSDRYVQCLPDTDQYRLTPDGSGYDNLVLAGDWTDCGINAGCIEAATVSGLQAANALLGRPRWNGILGRFLR